MKIAFSTLGCPDFDWPDIYSMAKDLGFDGIEMRGLGDDLFAVNARPFRADQIDKTIALLARMHLTIPCPPPGRKSATISAWLPGWAPAISACWPTATPTGRARWMTRWCWPT